MATSTLGQEWLDASEISTLNPRTQGNSEFPDPSSFYSLYCVIIKREPLRNLPNPSFFPFRGRPPIAEYMNDGRGGDSEYGGPLIKTSGEIVKDHGFWIGMLEQFLGGPSLIQFNVAIQKAELSEFGRYMFLELMAVFTHLYQQNDRLLEKVSAWYSAER